MAGNGLMYTAQFGNVAYANSAQDLWQITASTTASILIHSWRLTVVPALTSGVAQDLRMNLQILLRSTAGTGGTAVTPVAVNKRNSVAATSTWTRTVVTTQGTAGNIISGDEVSVIVPYERIYTPDQRLVLPAAASGSYLSLFLATAPGTGPTNWSSEVYFEEI
jgi:hypothetical protein